MDTSAGFKLEQVHQTASWPSPVHPSLSPLHFHLTDAQTCSLRCFAGPGVVSFQQEFFNPSYRLNIYFTLADETLAVGVCCVLPAGALQM